MELTYHWERGYISDALDLAILDHNELPLGDYIDAPVTWMVPA